MKIFELFSLESIKKSSLFIFTLILFSTQQLYASYSFLNMDSSVSSNAQLAAFIEKTVQKLPPSMLARFDKDKVTIKISLNRSYKKSSDTSNEYASIDQISEKEFQISLEPYFSHSHDQINLENLPVKDWLIQRQIFYGRSPQLKKDLFIPKHKNASVMLESILIHELSHAYDLLNVPYMKYLKTRLHCIQAAAAAGPMGLGHSPGALPGCQSLTKIESSVSTLPEFMHVAGWPERGFLFPENKYINNYADGTGNYYEAGSTYEAFAVNMEFFLLDPEFSCHRPNLYQFLKSYFEYTPFPEVNCASTKKILISNSDFLMDDNDTKPLFEFVDLDESKLYQIHYLYAGKNKEMMSKFGHGMLRLVFCDPKRKEVGPDCLKDTKYHIVGSFAAFIGDVQVNPLDGVFGGYAAHLFMSRLNSILDTYNDTELREVYSLPLKLNSLQKRRLLNAIYEAHWSYRGNYSFLSNNCAIETFSVIKTAFINTPTVLDSYVVRPDSLFELLKKLGIAEGSVFNTEQYAFDYGYFYPSLRSHYDASLKVLIDQGIVDGSFNLDKYIDLSPKERTQHIERVLQIKNAVKKGVALLASRQLESLALKKYYQDTLQSKLPEIMKKLESDASKFGIDKDKVISFIKKLSIPAETLELKESYGIPREDLVLQKLEKALQKEDRNSLKALKKQVLAFILSCLDKEQIDALTEFDDNISLTKQN